MTTVVSILMSDIVPLRDRGLWQGIINIIYATGSGTGAPLGGILADYIGWRWYEAFVYLIVVDSLFDATFLISSIQGFPRTIPHVYPCIFCCLCDAQTPIPRKYPLEGQTSSH